MKRVSGLVLLLALLCVPLQAAPVPVSGRIVDAAGKPVANAQVELLSILPTTEDGQLQLTGKVDREPAAKATTDAAGLFRLQAPDAGMWKVRVAATGFVPLQLPLAPLLEETELPDARLVPDVRLQVRLTDSQGRPIAGGRVRVEPPRPPVSGDGLWQLRPRWAITDAGGTVTLPRTKDEALTVRAAAVGFALSEQKNVRSGAVTLRLAGGRSRPILVRDSQGKPVPGVLVTFTKSSWIAGSTANDGLLDLVLPEGDTIELLLAAADGRRLSFVLKPAKPDEKGPVSIVLPAAVPLTGKVVSVPDGRPLGGAFVWTSDLGSAVKTTGAGSFRLPAVQDGDFVSAAAAGFFNDRARISPNQSPTLSLKPNLSATGIVVDEGGRPVAGATVRSDSSPAGRAAGLWGGSGVGFARSGESGRFRIGGLAPGFPGELIVTRGGYAPAKKEVPAREIGQPAPELRIVLRAGRTVFGAVLDSGRQPVAGARVVLEPANPSPFPRFRKTPNSQRLEGSTDAAGRFEVKNLPAGSFDLTVRGKGFAPLTVPGLTVPEGSGRTDLGTVVLSSGASLRGLVVDAQGRPVEGAEVRARTPQADPIFAFMMDSEPADAVSGADGSFLLEDRSPGERVDLFVNHPSYGPSSTPGVTIPAETPVRIVLRPTARVSGRVVDPEGKPVAGATVNLIEMRSMSFGGRSGLRPFGAHQSTKGDDEGAFAFDGVSPGFIQLRAQAPRRQSAEVEGLEVKAGGALTGVEIVLAPGGSIAGRVLGPDGQPIAGAQVRLAESGQNAMFSSFFPGSRGTDGDGRYRLDGVPPGPRTLEARAEGYARAVRDVDVTGEMEGVDFTLQKGLEISGRVVDDAGAPLPGAMVMLLTDRPLFTPPAISSADGGFRFAGVQDGTFSLAAHKEGYSLSREEPLTVTVAGASVAGVELKLSKGGAITGRLSGLEFSQLSRVRVWANVEMFQGQVDADGAYRISGLSPGPWQVTAVVPGTSLHASGRVTLEPGAAEARLDLQFGTGHELTGVVLRNGQPVAGAGLALTGKGTTDRQTGTTDHQGSFRFGGLGDGEYELAVSTPNGAQHRESIEMSGDREVRVELRTASLSGRVIDALDSTPVSGVRVSLEPPEGERTSFGDSLTTDARGTFRLLEIGDGAWKLKFVREGYAPAERDLRVDGSPLDDLEIRLSPTEGVAIEPIFASGQRPERIQVAVLDAGGKALSAGFYPVGETGRARIATVPPGSWQVLVESDQSAPAVVTVSVPGPAVRALLPPAGMVRIKVPALANDPAKATVTLTGSGGPFRSIGWSGTVDSEFDLYGGNTGLPRVPAGVWQVTARATDGRSWSGTATVTPGGVAEVTLQ